MPKKPGKKKGSDNNGKGAEDVKEKLSEVDKEWFQIQLKALEEKLQRRNDKMRSLEALTGEYQERYEQLLEDKADVVAYLKRTLQQRTDKISELGARLEGLQQVHATDKQTYDAKLIQSEADFLKMKEQLVSENMVLNKKLDALEEFKIQREQLMAKQEKQEESVKRLKETYETKIYEIEKKHIKEEDRLKKEMTVKLEQVASEFRKASHAQMSATTQRTVRENVNISAQVTQLSEKNDELTEENEELLERAERKTRTISYMEEQERSMVAVNAYRLKVISELSAKCSAQEKALQSLNSFYTERRNYELKIARLESEMNVLSQNVGQTSARTQERDATITDLKQKLVHVSGTKDNIKVCLDRASDSLKMALELHGEEDDEEEATSAEGKASAMEHREGVLNQILLLLNTAMPESVAVPLQQQRGPGTERDPSSTVDYSHGSLGLVPME